MKILLISYLCIILSGCYVKTNGTIGLDWNMRNINDSMFYHQVSICFSEQKQIAKFNVKYTEKIDTDILNKCIKNTDYKFISDPEYRIIK